MVASLVWFALLCFLALSWFSGIEVASGVSIAKVAAWIVGGLWLVDVAGRLAFPRSMRVRSALPRTRRLFAMMGMFASVAVASTLLASTTGAALGRLGTLASLLLMVVVLCDQVRTREDMQTAYCVFSISGLVFCMVAAIGTVVRIPWLAASSHLFAGQERIIGASWDPNFLALSTATCVGLGYYALRQSRSIPVKVVMLFGLLCAVYATLMSFSRAGALILLIPAVGILFARGHRLRRAAIIAAGVMILVALIPTTLLEERVSSLGALPSVIAGEAHVEALEDSLEIRLSLMAAAVRMMMANPLLGIGFGHFAARAQEYGALTNSDAHNMYLSIGGELGIPGLLIFCIILAQVLRLSQWTRHNSPAGACRESAKGLMVGLATILGGAFFLSAQTERPLWILVSLVICSYAATRRGLLPLRSDERSSAQPETGTLGAACR